MAALTLTKKKDSKAKASTKTVEAPKLSKKARAEMDKPFVPTLPIVNLLSPEVQEAVEQARLKRLFVGLASGLVAMVVAVWILQAGVIAVANRHVKEAQHAHDQLAAKQQALAPVQTYYGQIDANRFTIQKTMADEVLTSQVIGALEQITPNDVHLSSVAINLPTSTAATGGAAATTPGATGNVCPSQDPYNGSASAGCLTVDGTAGSREVLSQWLDKIDADPSFTVAFIPSTTADTKSGEVTFAATIGLDGQAVHKNRYSNPDFLKAGK